MNSFLHSRQDINRLQANQVTGQVEEKTTERATSAADWT